MSAITFDTLKFSNQLKAVGFTESQAEAIVELQRESSHLDELATKRDLKELERDIKEIESAMRHDMKDMESSIRHDMKDMETRLQHQIELLRADTARQIAETNQRISESKADLTRWIIGAGFLQTTLIIGVLLKVAHLI